jgi:phosphoglycerol transferase
MAVWGFYIASRLLRAAPLWSSAGAMIFGFSRYIFAQAIVHIQVVFCWHVPLCLVAAEWLLLGGGIAFGSRRFIFAVAVAMITAVQSIYYTNLFCQLVLIAGLYQAWRHGWRAALPAAAILGVTLATLGFDLMDSILYKLIYGGNSAGAYRNYSGMEVAGMKLVDLWMPPPDDFFHLLANYGARHMAQSVLPPGEFPPSGYLGFAGLGCLAWLVTVSLRRVAEGVRMPLEAFYILWIFLYSEIGGIDCITGTFGFVYFRTASRYSIFILGLVLMFAARRLSAVDWKEPARIYFYTLLAVAVAILNQIPPPPSSASISAIAAQVASDREFTAALERRLPPHAQVFQIPVMLYPESPVGGIGAYEHFRPYYFTDQLRFSFGTVKGRERDLWQEQMEGMPVPDMVRQLEAAGFSALYINRAGFADNASALLGELAKIGQTETIESPNGDLVAVILKPSF